MNKISHQPTGSLGAKANSIQIVANQRPINT